MAERYQRNQRPNDMQTQGARRGSEEHGPRWQEEHRWQEDQRSHGRENYRSSGRDNRGGRDPRSPSRDASSRDFGESLHHYAHDQEAAMHDRERWGDADLYGGPVWDQEHYQDPNEHNEYHSRGYGSANYAQPRANPRSREGGYGQGGFGSAQYPGRGYSGQQGYSGGQAGSRQSGFGQSNNDYGNRYDQGGYGRPGYAQGYGQTGFGHSGYSPDAQNYRPGSGSPGFNSPRYGAPLTSDNRGSNWGNTSNQRSESFYGRGPKGYTRSDERIREDICDRLSDDDELDASDISVSVKNGEVTLEGEVADRASKHRAEDIADAVSGVTDVHNRIRARKGLMRELEDKLTGREETPHGHAGSGTKNTPSTHGSTGTETTASTSSTGTTTGSSAGTTSPIRNGVSG
ncbi:MAG TPA: BON domain-containing protein [Polyangiaceae bacterium]|nr:BON domain-containing protein [Polyangiaceae bacterium]